MSAQDTVATYLETKVGEGKEKPQAPFYPTTGQPQTGEGFFCAPPNKAWDELWDLNQGHGSKSPEAYNH